MRVLLILLPCLTLCNVTNSQTYVRQGASGNSDGTSWTNAYPNLQDALNNAQDGDEIWVAAGTYSPIGSEPDSSHFKLDRPVKIFGGFAGNETSIMQRKWKSNKTVICGDLNTDDIAGRFDTLREDNAHHIIFIDAADGTCVLDGLIFKGGTTNLENPPGGIDRTPWRGGALYARTGVKIDSCRFYDNSGWQGPAVYICPVELSIPYPVNISEVTIDSNYATSGGTIWTIGLDSLVIQGCTFRNNDNFQFPALRCDNGNLTLQNCTFESNRALATGAVTILQLPGSLIPSPVLRVHGCTFRNNESDLAGGALLYGNYSEGARIIIQHCAFDQNRSDDGGSIYIRGYDNDLLFQMSSCHVSNSTASGDGAGIYINNGANADILSEIRQTVFNSDSSSGSGGAIFFDNYFSTTHRHVAIDSCTFINNYSGRFGGAISSYQQKGDFRDCTFSGNSSKFGSGAIDSGRDSLNILRCRFEENNTEAISTGFGGGGAVQFWDPGYNTITNTLFEANQSKEEGSSIFAIDSTVITLTNVLIQGDSATSAIYNQNAIVNSYNLTMIDNESGLKFNNGTGKSQNSIYHNRGPNFEFVKEGEITSGGSNISGDKTLSGFLTHSTDYPDRHNLDPLLGSDLTPTEGSPCVDAGNPDGITAMYDLAGEPRFFGHEDRIDIGCYESKVVVHVEDVQWNSLELNTWPNPANDVLHLEINEDWIGETQVNLYDAVGRLVYYQKSNKTDLIQQLTINAREFTQGQYYLIVKTNEYYGNKVLIRHP